MNKKAADQNTFQHPEEDDEEMTVTLELEDGTHFDIRVLIPAGFEGELTVRFQPPWYWRMGELISLLSLSGITVLSLLRKCPGIRFPHYA